MENTNYKIALLIDCENISSKYMGTILEELNPYGKIIIRRIYGDFTSNERKGWKDILLEYGISPMQQYSYTSGKNSTDTAMVIDAMDILYTGKVDCFCLATSDSDFTKLAIRLKEEGLFVIGAGEEKTPKSFSQICDRFILVDALYNSTTSQKTTQKAKATTQKATQEQPAKSKQPTHKIEDKVKIPPKKEIIQAINSFIDDNDITEDNWADFSLVINQLYRKYPEFSPKLYGNFKKPLAFLKSTNKFQFQTIGTAMYIKKI